MNRISAAASAAAFVWSFSLVPAAEALAQVTVTRPQGVSVIYGNANRAMLGVTLAAASRGDTLGVRIDEVNANGPAAKAGLKAGMIVTAINGVSLQVSRDDAADEALVGIAQRRFTRTLQQVKPGDEVELRVRDGNQARTVRVKAVAASELQGESVRRATAVTAASANRAVVGLSIGVSGTVRDTLGLFVSSVVRDGPAEKAGIIEGDRIAAINGVDLRVPREDVEDAPSSMARVTRFNREVQKATVGDRVTLRVWNAGRYRDVQVTTVKASELPRRGFQMHMGDGQFLLEGGAGMPGLRIFSRDGEGTRILRLDSDSLRLELSGPDRERIERVMEELRSNLRELPARIRSNLEPLRIREIPRGRIETEPSAVQPVRGTGRITYL
jgi:serine protease Do